MEPLQVHYSDGDMVILDNLADFQQVETTGAGMILSIIVVDGRLRIDIGGVPTEVRAHDMLICPPGTVPRNLKPCACPPGRKACWARCSKAANGAARRITAFICTACG